MADWVFTVVEQAARAACQECGGSGRVGGSVLRYCRSCYPAGDPPRFYRATRDGVTAEEDSPDLLGRVIIDMDCSGTDLSKAYKIGIEIGRLLERTDG